jgi:hypothetical protein
VKLSLGVSGLLVVCVMLGIGCASADDVSSDTQATAGDRLEAEGDLASVEQAITMPATDPTGPAQQCVSACTRFSTTDITGLCCICNNVTKKFARQPGITNMYACR